MAKKKLEKPKKHIEAISNGLGAPSIYMLVMASEERIPARLSITGDTGWENDRLWSDGTRSSNQVYFDQVVLPFCKQHGIEAVMVEALDENGQKVPPLGEWIEQFINEGKFNHIKIPLFGSDGGRLRQPCTQRKKVIAIRQELRRRGATTARTAHALTMSEVHRMKGRNGRTENGFYTLTSIDAAWHSHYYPVIDAGMHRFNINAELERRGIPYLLSSECDGCPHQDWPRWSRHTQETIDHLAELEAKTNGQFFFTDERIPLKEALVVMKEKWEAKRLSGGASFELDNFGCDEGGVCGV